MKKQLLILFIVIFILGAVNTLNAQTWPAFNVCCEKTLSGAWCQNTLKGNCATSIDLITKAPLRETPTSCDATSFCKLGCCIDSAEGLCMENTPLKVCQISTGTWVDDAKCNVAQCRLGCCILGDQASFVTLTRCKRLSSLYGLNTNFRRDISSESSCVALAFSQDKGACVYEIENQKTCRFTTRGDCLNSEKAEKAENLTSKPEFFKDYLCSADELGTNCGPTTDTICLPGRDEVYFKDSCGNPANIYDAGKIYSKNPGYWKKIVLKTNSCNYKSKDGSKNSKTCGNCNYLDGSICGKGSAAYGNYVCKDVNCYNTENGKDYKNGESWCIYMSDTGNGKDDVGSRHFRHVCISGEETIEPCADFRNEVCYEQPVKIDNGNFIEAGCRVNRWADCIDQNTEKKCLNTDKRECYWYPGFSYDGAGKKNKTATNSLLQGTNQKQGTGIVNGTGICLPNYPPGLKFWESGDAGGVCSLGNSIQIVEYSTNIFGSKTCKNNCDVLESAWANRMNEICTSLGDCGAKSNFVGVYTDDGIEWKDNGNLKTLGGAIIGGIGESARE
ncbi:MAG: hypothetical protein AABX54_00695 [Nanoarchaeota archaeon]